MQQNSIDKCFVINGKYTLFHKTPEFLEFLCEALQLVADEALEFSEKERGLLRTLYKSSKSVDILQFFNEEVLANSYKNFKKLTFQQIELLLTKKIAHKMRIIEEFLLDSRYKNVIILRSSSLLKLNFLQTLISLNFSEKIQVKCSFSLKTDPISPLETSNSSIICFISHKLSDEPLVSLRKTLQTRSFFLYFHNLFLNLQKKALYDSEKASADMEISLLSTAPQIIDFLTEFPKEKALKIGYFFLMKKLEDMYEKHMISNEFPLLFLPLDLRFPPKLCDSYDLIIHKCTDLVKYYGNSSKFMSLCKENLQTLETSHFPQKPFIDPVKSLAVVNNRLEFQRVFEEFFTNSASFNKTLEDTGLDYRIKVPKSFRVEKGAKLCEIQAKFSVLSMNFPVIIKTVEALGAAKTHYMAICVSFEGLETAEKHEYFRGEEHLVQEFINHDETIYKIYNIGEKTHYYTRQSMPNVDEKTLGGAVFFFDSQKSFKEQLEFLKKREENWVENEGIDSRLFEVMAKEIRKNVGMTLFGYDLIKDRANKQDVYIIDINYFPGFKVKEDLKKLFKEFFIKKIEEFKK